MAHDSEEFFPLDSPLDPITMLGLVSELGATFEELELIEDIKWTVRYWSAASDATQQLRPVTVRDIWQIISDPELSAKVFQHRPFGPLDPQEQDLLNTFLRLLAPRVLSDIRMSSHTVYYHGRCIGWQDSDQLLRVCHVMRSMFKLEGLSIREMDNVSLSGLATRLNDASYRAQLDELEETHYRPKDGDCVIALEYFRQLEQWLARQAA